MKNWYQFKLSSGEEILADVITFPEEDDPDQIIVCNHILEIKYIENPGHGRVAYLRPYLVDQLDDHKKLMIYGFHIMIFAKPASKLILLAEEAIHAYQKEAGINIHSEEESLDNFLNDSDINSNILSFKPKTIH